MIDLTVLDFDGTARTAADLGPIVEAAGYTRYWIAEHQPQASPLLAAALVLGLTHRLRVGTAGVLLAYHSVYRVAQDFRLLDLLFGDRVDAGFCPGGAEESESRAIRDGMGPLTRSEYEERARTFVALLRDELGSDHRWHGVSQISRGPATQPWSLGLSTGGALLAAELGVSYAHSLFHQYSQAGSEPVVEYRRHFGGAPGARRVAVAVAGACATSQGAAAEICAHYKDYSFIRPTLIGDVQQCASHLALLRDTYDMDEVVFLDLAQRFDDKVLSYQCFAEAARRAF
jgi:alkanesulfonate monooxygenase SsuD/methylene tetrahydromethanopterin reductase-like flavin-dependent oxidoreductase (luciferase family)